MALVMIEQTNYCNLTCPACTNHLHLRKQGVMKPDFFRHAIEELVSYYGEEIKKVRLALHGGGEPLLSPFLLDNLKILDEFCFTKADFSTNGMFLDKFIEPLKKFNCLYWVRVSLNSSKKEAMEIINRGSDFEKVVENIKFLLAFRPRFKISVQHMLCKLTENETKNDFYDLLGRGFEYGQKVLHSYGQQTKSGLESQLAPVSCNNKFCPYPVMHWDGDIVGCCADDTKTQVLGNIKDGLKPAMEKGAELRKEFEARDFKNLPLCRKCFKK